MKSKIRLFNVVSILLLLAAFTALADDSISSSKTNSVEKLSPSSPLEPVMFLVGGKWEAKLPDKPDGSHVSIIAQFAWANNHQAIRISTAFSDSGKSMPYLDGMYAWHPQKQKIVFWYVDAKGSLTEGTVKTENGAIIHEFQETDSTGAVQQYTARVTREGSSAWVNEIFAGWEGHLQPIIKVRYTKME